MNDTATERPQSPELPADAAVIRPMIQLKPLMDAGTPMDVRQADYHDPQRWWL